MLGSMPPARKRQTRLERLEKSEERAITRSCDSGPYTLAEIARLRDTYAEVYGDGSDSLIMEVLPGYTHWFSDEEFRILALQSPTMGNKAEGVQTSSHREPFSGPTSNDSRESEWR